MNYNPFDKIWRFSVVKYDGLYTSPRHTLFDIYHHLQSWDSLDEVPYRVFLASFKDLLLKGKSTIKVGYNDYHIYVDENTADYIHYDSNSSLSNVSSHEDAETPTPIPTLF